MLLGFTCSASTGQHSTAQRSPPAQAAEQVRADQSATTQASIQSWLEAACRRAFIQLVVFSKRTKKSKSARPTRMYNHSQSSLAGVMLPVHCSSLRPFYFVHACGVRIVFVDHGALGICKSPVCTLNHVPLCPRHPLSFCSILPCERA